MNKKFIELLAEGSNGKPLGGCPYCESESLGFQNTILNKATGVGYSDIWCANCKRAYHLSRGIFEKEQCVGSEKPLELKY